MRKKTDMAIKVSLHSLENAGPKQRALIERAIELIERAVNHPDFIPRVRSAPYKQTRFSPRTGPAFTATVEDIVAVLQNGRERDTADDAEIDLEITLAKLRAPSPLRAGVVGHTDTGRQPVTTAYWFMNDCIARDDAISPARHFLHEWLHVAGFVHFPNNSARDDPPYLIGEIVQDILNDDAGKGLMARQSAEGRAALEAAVEAPADQAPVD